MSDSDNQENKTEPTETTPEVSEQTAASPPLTWKIKLLAGAGAIYLAVTALFLVVLLIKGEKSIRHYLCINHKICINLDISKITPINLYPHPPN